MRRARPAASVSSVRALGAKNPVPAEARVVHAPWRYRPRPAWFSGDKHSERTLRWLTAHNYRIDLKTPQSFVAVRADLPIVAAVSGTPAPCFPGP